MDLYPPPRSPMVTPPLYTALRHSGSFWLVVGCKTINRRPSKARVYYNLVFFLVRFATQIDVIASPPVLHTGCASSSTSLPPWPPITIWLLCFYSKCRPPKANTPLSISFFDVPSFHPPKRGTSHRSAKPDHGRLALDHREPRHHWLVALIAFPWRDEV